MIQWEGPFLHRSSDLSLATLQVSLCKVIERSWGRRMLQFPQWQQQRWNASRNAWMTMSRKRNKSNEDEWMLQETKLRTILFPFPPQPVSQGIWQPCCIAIPLAFHGRLVSQRLEMPSTLCDINWYESVHRRKINAAKIPSYCLVQSLSAFILHK